MKRKLLALALTACMALSLLPVSALGAETDSAPTMPGSIASGNAAEQFGLTVGATYWFDLTGEDIPGTVNTTLPDDALHYVPFTYAGTVNAYTLNSASGGVTNSSGMAAAATEPGKYGYRYDHSLFLADYNVTGDVSWDALAAADLIFGTQYHSGGALYSLRSLTGGSIAALPAGGEPGANEWDAIITKSFDLIKNRDGVYTWCQDTTAASDRNRATRGYHTADVWESGASDTAGAAYGFRPVLEVVSLGAGSFGELTAVTLDLVDTFDRAGSMDGESSIQIVVAKDKGYRAPSGEGLTAPEGMKFMCWMDTDWNFYYPGETVTPEHGDTLYAQWADASMEIGIDYQREVLTGFKGSKAIIGLCTLETLPEEAIYGGTIPIQADWFGASLLYGGSGGQLVVMRIDVPARPVLTSAPSVVKTATSITLSNTADAPICLFSEDRVNWADSWELTGLTPGNSYTMYIKQEATATSFRSEPTTLTITTTAADGSTILKHGESVFTGDGGTITNNDGTIIIDKNGDGEPDTTVTLPDSRSASVGADGTVAIPGGSTIQAGDGPVMTLPDGGTADSDGNVAAITDGKIQVGDTTITPPGGGTITVDQVGGISLPEGETITVTGGSGTATTITPPTGGGKIEITDDGKLIVPGGTTIQVGSDEPVTVPDSGGTLDPSDGSMTASTHTVTFDSQSGSAVTSVTVAHGGKAAKPTDSTRSGYTFGGWYKESTCTTAWNFATDTVTDDVTLYAKWTQNGSGGAVSNRPSAKVDGEGGTIKIGNGTVTITPDEGYQIATVTVNGKAVDIPESGKLTGLKRTDKVLVAFKKIPEMPPLDIGKYTDLDTATWYYEAAKYAVENGLFYGTSDTAFSPDSTMTRAMLMTVLARADGRDTTAPDGGTWYDVGMSWAMEQGISDGTNPDGAITCEQLAAMLWRYAGSPDSAGTLDGFTDADKVDGYATSALVWAVKQGIVIGKGGGILDPKGEATRAQVAAMLMRYLTGK